MLAKVAAVAQLAAAREAMSHFDLCKTRPRWTSKGPIKVTTFSRASMTAHEAPIIVSKRPKMAFRTSKRGPRRPEESSMPAQDGFKTPPLSVQNYDPIVEGDRSL